jgi:mono/diheme cytochrome c family protein
MGAPRVTGRHCDTGTPQSAVAPHAGRLTPRNLSGPRAFFHEPRQGPVVEVSMTTLTRSLWFRIGLGALGAFAVMQLVPYGRSHNNPAARDEPAWDSPATRALAKQACFDCHSNETVWPGYASVAPVSWLVQHDVDEGRAALNFSEWTKPQKEAREAAGEVRESEMPPGIYLLMHGDARLSDADRQRLAAGLALTLGDKGKQENSHAQ